MFPLKHLACKGLTFEVARDTLEISSSIMNDAISSLKAIKNLDSQGHDPIVDITWW